MLDTSLNDRQAHDAIDLIESCAWGDMDSHIRSMEGALERILKATAEDFPLWEQDGEELYIDEFSVSDDDLSGMSTQWRLAYIARLVRTLAMCYGLETGDFGDRPPMLLAYPRSPAGLLRALNDLTWMPLTTNRESGD